MADPVPTDAQRANMTETEWDALTDEQRAERRAAFAPPPAADAPPRESPPAPVQPATVRTDAQRAGLTASQWAALTEQERASLRIQYPAPVPPEALPVPSPPDPHNTAILGNTGERGVQPSVPAVPLPEPDPDEDMTHLPNAPGGRNNPSLSNYDPSRKSTA